MSRQDAITPDPFGAITRYRLAARTIARAATLGARRLPALAELTQDARRELAGDDFTLRAARAAILAESAELVYEARTPASPAIAWRGDPVTNALRALRARGVDRCRECKRAVPSLDALARAEDRDRAGWIEALHRESAPEHESRVGGAA